MVKKDNLGGSIIYINYGPGVGHEQQKIRPALVVSNKVFNKYCNMTLVLPISHSVDYPLHIDLPEGLKTKGKVLCEHIKSIDLEAREWTYIESVDNIKGGRDYMNKIRNILCDCIAESN